jgi:DNA-binding MarR family transcriptional regulator
MTKTNRTSGSRDKTRDLRALLHVPQNDLQTQLSHRLSRLGFPALRPGHVQLLNALKADGVRLAELVSALSLPKQTVGDLVDDLERMRMVERFPDPDHGVAKRVRLGPRGKLWVAEVKRVANEAEARWAVRLGGKKMKSLRALLEELAATCEERRLPQPRQRVNGTRHARRG